MGNGQNALLKVLTPRREISRALGISAGAMIAGLIFLFWCVLTYGELVDTTFCPPPHRVLLALWKVLGGNLADFVFERNDRISNQIG